MTTPSHPAQPQTPNPPQVPVAFLPITPETPPKFPCWAYDYMWKMVYVPGHLLDQHTHWAPGGTLTPPPSPYGKPAEPPTPRAVECAKDIHHFNIAMVDDRCTLPPDRIAAIISKHYSAPAPDEVARLREERDAAKKRRDEWKDAGMDVCAEKNTELTALRAEVTRLTAALAEAEKDGERLRYLEHYGFWDKPSNVKTWTFSISGMPGSESSLRMTLGYSIDLALAARPNQSAT